MVKKHKLDPETRYRVMSSIKSVNTKPEIIFRKTLWSMGVRGWRCHVVNLPGKPDLAFKRNKLAIFVDGVWWHGHPKYFKLGSKGAYWDKKIQGNKKRDSKNNKILRKMGWKVLRIWDIDILSNPTKQANLVIKRLNKLNQPQ
ncbi:MAG: very short patch repair endonuclease [Candidatus Omnitrophica bacterium]|nr:very short patch repair endonuclease [Candidatus Omnitrophota bacterium]MBU1047052.1 very short patch repair endonuclease [Candidatus Omnitrophota bacterium]MBU1630973.1 very short patch repair endonuclease [Candidatus Omnitrophota bacterium]MBU1767043.1 very short patch repair endonuclease [Candidatus Omnitrophota bacterium]MBU1889278.1 very short patch repair endonuclease [Candidatus Omnitrophota bacterium]